MLELTKSNINSVKVKELNNGWIFRFKCSKTNNEVIVYKEHSIYNVKIIRVNINYLPVEWLQMEKLSTVRKYLKQLVF